MMLDKHYKTNYFYYSLFGQIKLFGIIEKLAHFEGHNIKSLRQDLKWGFYIVVRLDRALLLVVLCIFHPGKTSRSSMLMGLKQVQTVAAWKSSRRSTLLATLKCQCCSEIEELIHY